jgi:hypothetical protein
MDYRSLTMSLLVIAVSLATGGISESRAATVADWRRDVDAIVRDVVAYHPDPFSRTGELTFLRSAKALKDALPRLHESQRIVALMRLIASLGDGHTTVELQDRKYAVWYPVRLYEFSNGYFVTSAHVSVRELAGAEILKIADRPTAEVVDAARSLFGADNRFDTRERLFAVHNAFLMEGLGYASQDGSLEISARLRNGDIVNRVLIPRAADDRYSPGVPIFEWTFQSEVYGMPFGTADEWVAAFGNLPSSAFQQPAAERPPHLHQRTRYSRRALPRQDAYYIQLNQTDDGGMGPFMAEALREVDQQQPRRLILDVRYNFGGDGSVVASMLHQFIRRQLDPPWQELYLITGPKTFSAAMAIVVGLREHTIVSIVGEPAGAPPNFFGDAESRQYPAIGLDLHVSTLRHQLVSSDDLRTHVPVDVLALMSFQDYVSGRDPAVDDILRGREMRSLPVIARMDGGAAARRVFHDRRKRFQSVSWWSAPEEIQLRFACDDLLAAERVEHALETCRLNSEIHPFVWNTWYNLAGAQKQAGMEVERLSSYQCVVELAPNNWNVPGIRRLFARLQVQPEPPPGCPTGK